jgi:hypothetical protein
MEKGDFSGFRKGVWKKGSRISLILSISGRRLTLYFVKAKAKAPVLKEWGVRGRPFPRGKANKG